MKIIYRIGIPIFLIVLLITTYLKYKQGIEVIEVDKKANVYHSYFINGFKLFGKETLYQKYDEIAKVKLINKSTRDTLCLDGNYFNSKIGNVANIQFCCPLIFIDLIEETKYGFKSQVPLTSDSSSWLFGDISYEVTEGRINNKNLNDYYLENVKSIIMQNECLVGILSENISRDYVNVTLLYRINEKEIISVNRMIKDEDKIFNIEYSCPYRFYQLYDDFIASIYAKTALISDLEELKNKHYNNNL